MFRVLLTCESVIRYWVLLTSSRITTTCRKSNNNNTNHRDCPSKPLVVREWIADIEVRQPGTHDRREEGEDRGDSGWKIFDGVYP